jgi:hypothetical protein
MKELTVWKPSTELTELVEGAQAQLELASAHVVNSLQTYEFADKDLTSVAGDLKKLEAMKVTATMDLKALLKARTDYFNPAIKALEAAKNILRQKMGAFNKRQEAVAKAAQAEAQQAADELDVPAPIIQSATANVGGTKYRDHWNYKVTDWTALVQYVMANINNEVHGQRVSDWLSPNERVLKAMAKSVRKEVEVAPGLEIVNDRIAVSG